jgi:hypothetical protein
VAPSEPVGEGDAQGRRVVEGPLGQAVAPLPVAPAGQRVGAREQRRLLEDLLRVQVGPHRLVRLAHLGPELVGALRAAEENALGEYRHAPVVGQLAHVA